MSESRELVAYSNPSVWRRFKDRLRMPRRFLCRAMNWVGLPGMIREYKAYDMVLGKEVHIYTMGSTTNVCIGGRDISFDRLTGRHIGTGYSFGCGGGLPTPPVADGVKLTD